MYFVSLQKKLYNLLICQSSTLFAIVSFPFSCLLLKYGTLLLYCTKIVDFCTWEYFLFLNHTTKIDAVNSDFIICRSKSEVVMQQQQNILNLVLLCLGESSTQQLPNICCKQLRNGIEKIRIQLRLDVCNHFWQFMEFLLSLIFIVLAGA